MRAHTAAPYTMDLRRETLRALDRPPGGPDRRRLRQNRGRRARPAPVEDVDVRAVRPPLPYEPVHRAVRNIPAARKLLGCL